MLRCAKIVTVIGVLAALTLFIHEASTYSRKNVVQEVRNKLSLSV